MDEIYYGVPGVPCGRVDEATEIAAHLNAATNDDATAYPQPRISQDSYCAYQELSNDLYRNPFSSPVSQAMQNAAHWQLLDAIGRRETGGCYLDVEPMFSLERHGYRIDSGLRRVYIDDPKGNIEYQVTGGPNMPPDLFASDGVGIPICVPFRCQPPIYGEIPYYSSPYWRLHPELRVEIGHGPLHRFPNGPIGRVPGGDVGHLPGRNEGHVPGGPIGRAPGGDVGRVPGGQIGHGPVGGFPGGGRGRRLIDEGTGNAEAAPRAFNPIRTDLEFLQQRPAAGARVENSWQTHVHSANSFMTQARPAAPVNEVARPAQVRMAPEPHVEAPHPIPQRRR